jgi:hypothetical protein
MHETTQRPVSSVTPSQPIMTMAATMLRRFRTWWPGWWSVSTTGFSTKSCGSTLKTIKGNNGH